MIQHTKVDVRRTSDPAAAPYFIAQRMAAVREAFRLQRLARASRRLWVFYLEHNLFDQARDCRQTMIGHLRDACQQWRLTLGTGR
jgi:hypothetical protein